LCETESSTDGISDSWYDLHWFAIGTVTPDIALSEFKKWGFPIKDLNTVKEKQEIIVAEWLLF
jgi:hypothetical protein